MLILGLDFETTGFDSVNDRIIEVGAVLWEWESHKPVDMFCSLVFDAHYPDPMDPEITEVTGITMDDLHRFGVTTAYAYAMVMDMMEKTNFCMAHNGVAFDRPFWHSECARQGDTPADKVWIDTQNDVPYSDRIKTRKLSHLAAEHGFLNPFQHRAVFDVLTMLTIASKYPIETIIDLAKQPLVQLQAHTSFQNKDLAKDVGYRWFPKKKWWLKTIKQGQVEKELALAAEIGFKCTLRPDFTVSE